MEYSVAQGRKTMGGREGGHDNNEVTDETDLGPVWFLVTKD